jgi:hypothetical protein
VPAVPTNISENQLLADWLASRLIQIFKLHKLEVVQKKQETPGRIVASLNKAHVVGRRSRSARTARERERARKELEILPLSTAERERARKELERVRQELKRSPASDETRKGLEAARNYLESLPAGILPASIQWSRASGLAMGTGGSPLRNTVQRLQALACEWDEDLAWKDGPRPPQKLTEFITARLDTAKIKYPSPDYRLSEFLALMLGPREESPRSDPIEIEEGELAKRCEAALDDECRKLARPYFYCFDEKGELLFAVPVASTEELIAMGEIGRRDIIGEMDDWLASPE